MEEFDERIRKVAGHMRKDDLLWIYARSCEVPDGGIIVEVGSFRGRSAAAWYQGIKSRGKLYCVDPWDTDHPGGRPSDYELFKENMLQLGYSPEVLRMPSIEAAEEFDDGSVDIVFLDGNHREVCLDIDTWIPKLKPDGLLCGHDWKDGRPLQERIAKKLPDAVHVVGRIWQLKNDNGKDRR